MKKWKSILSAALAGIMILSAVVSVGAANVSFTDVSSHWAKSQINYLVGKDVLNGYKQNNGTYIFKPNGTVTRAEFIKMLDETFGLTATAPINYSDVKSSDWFHPYIAKAAAQGYLLNYGKSIAPNGQLTREEAITLLVRYLDLLDGPKAATTKFADYNQISSHFQTPVLIAAQAGLVEGSVEKGANYFKPKDTLTRAEALTILYRAAGAIYNTSAYSKDTAAPADNAVITKGGVTLSGLKLNGRVIVTEGAAGDKITLTGCTVTGSIEVRGTATLELNGCIIDSLVLDSDSAITLNLSGNTRITAMTLNSRANMTIATGCTVSDMTVNSNASNIDIRGNGAIGKLSVYAPGFFSTMMPTEFFIASGLTANLASAPYSGSSDDQASFSMMPYMTEEDDQYYLNITPDVSGRVYYYFTNLSHIPSAGEFDSPYSAATYKDNFYVQAGKNYSEVTIDTAQAKKYDYVIVKLEADDRSYAPVLIENMPTTGSGFAVDPYFDGSDITYTADLSGTVYYYYSKDGDELTSAQFQTGYKNAKSDMKGTEDANYGRTGTIELKEQYLEDYPFVIVVLKNMNDQYFKPVVIAAGDNGFSEDPEITTLGTIEFKTSVSGTLYYYYASDDKMPTPKEVANNWRTEFGRGSKDVTRNKRDSVKYELDNTDRYPYMVFCIKTSDGTYLTPFVLKVDHDTGFAVDPYVSGNEEISFRTEHNGTVYWYFTRYNSTPSMDDFMAEYSATTSSRRGYEIVRSTTSYGSFTFDSSYADQYPYIAIMLEDTSDRTYQPVIVDVKNTTATGFNVDPYCDLTEEAVYFKTEQSGTVYYYFSRVSASYNESSEEFWESYTNAKSGYYGSASVTTSFDRISFSSIDTDDYPGIVLMFVDDDDREYYPVYVSITRDSSSGNSTTGITVLSVSDSEVKFSVDISGTLEYYFMGYGANTSTHYGSGSRTVTRNGVVTITHNGRYNFLVLELEGYDHYVVDLTKDYDRDNAVDDGSNKSGYGFSSHLVEHKDDQVIFIAIANVTGTVSASIDNRPGSGTSVSVTKGEIFEIVLDYNSDPFPDLPSIGQLIGAGKLQVQLTSGKEVYERLEVSLS